MLACEQVKPVHCWTWAHAMSHGVVPVALDEDVVVECVLELVVVDVLPVAPPVPVVVPAPVFSTVVPPQPPNHEMVTPSATVIPKA
jgi:hypothetical protein